MRFKQPKGSPGIRPRGDADCPRLSNRLFQLLRQHFRDAPEVTGKTSSHEIAGLVKVSKVLLLILRHVNET
jgi:hypothetical protein